MSGYLDHYGEGEERRIRLVKRSVISLVTLLVAGGILFFVFHNYRQQQQVQRFFDLLAGHDYADAYALWVRTDADRHDYPMKSFMQDWGPESGRTGDPKEYRIAKSRSCGSGVIFTVDSGKPAPETLWVERSTLTIGFSPYPGCAQLVQ